MKSINMSILCIVIIDHLNSEDDIRYCKSYTLLKNSMAYSDFDKNSTFQSLLSIFFTWLNSSYKKISLDFLVLLDPFSSYYLLKQLIFFPLLLQYIANLFLHLILTIFCWSFHKSMKIWFNCQLINTMQHKKAEMEWYFWLVW